MINIASKSTNSHVLTHVHNIDPHWILLDSESIVNIFVYIPPLLNFRGVKDPLVSVTNSGLSRTSIIAYLKECGDEWYSNRYIVNILSLFLVIKKLRVTYDSESKNKLTVFRSDCSTIIFEYTHNRLNYHGVRWKRRSVKVYIFVYIVGGGGVKLYYMRDTTGR